MTVSFESISAAAEAIADVVVRTPTIASAPLSAALGADIYLKLEVLQRTGSFKDRGALVKLLSLSDQQRKSGVIAVSAGNHAQGVAYHAQRLGIPATIVMPEATPFTKIVRTEAFGARVLLHGESVNAAEPFAQELAEADSLTPVHPYDDDLIVSGQGTIALEMLADVDDLDTIVVPIGGGGVIAGIATAAKALSPKIEIIGVEAAQYPSMYEALHGLAPTSGGNTIAEGIAIKAPGTIAREIAERLVDEILLVSEFALETAVLTMLENSKVLAEGAGAAALAAVMENRERFAGRKVGLVVCGGNIDARLLASVLMRGLVRTGRIVRLRVTITDRPGALAQVAQQIAAVGGDIIEIAHQRLFQDVPVKLADLDVLVETRDKVQAADIIAQLNREGLPTRQLGISNTDA
jgi:threonine dehydratase